MVTQVALEVSIKVLNFFAVVRADVEDFISIAICLVKHAEPKL